MTEITEEEARHVYKMSGSLHESGPQEYEKYGRIT